MASLQTAWAQKMIVRMIGSETAEFDISRIEDVIFVEAEPVEEQTYTVNVKELCCDFVISMLQIVQTREYFLPRG